jgi:hypothetical protein
MKKSLVKYPYLLEQENAFKFYSGKTSGCKPFAYRNRRKNVEPNQNLLNIGSWDPNATF